MQFAYKLVSPLLSSIEEQGTNYLKHSGSKSNPFKTDKGET